MPEIFSLYALDWLELKLLPLVLEAAGLPPDTTPAGLLEMDLPTPNDPDFAGYILIEAGFNCQQLVLYGAVLLAAELAGTDQARQLALAVCGLIWQTAAELAKIRDMAMLCDDYHPDFERVQQKWQLWEQTDQPALELIQRFLQDSVSASLDR